MTGTAKSMRDRIAVAVMLTGSVMMALIFTVLSPALPQIAEHYSHTDGMFIAQLIMSAPGIGVIVGGLSGGTLVDRFGRKRLLLIGLALFAAAGSAPLYVQSAWPLLASRALLGWSGATIQASIIGMIATVFTGPQRAKMLGYEAAIGSAAAVLSILASGQIAEHFGWRAPTVLYLFALIVLVAAAYALPRDGTERLDQGAEEADGGAATSAAMGPLVRRIALFLLLIPFLYAANYMLSIQMPFLLAENGVVGPAAKSRLMVVGVIFGVIGAASSGWLRAGIGERPSLLLTIALMGSGYAVLGLSHGAGLVLLGGALAGLGGGTLLPSLMAIATARADRALRSRAAGLVYSLAYVGEFLNPLVFRPLTGAVGIHGTYLTAGSALWAMVLIGLAAGLARTPNQTTKTRS